LAPANESVSLRLRFGVEFYLQFQVVAFDVAGEFGVGSVRRGIASGPGTLRLKRSANVKAAIGIEGNGRGNLCRGALELERGAAASYREVCVLTSPATDGE
jgi:hypothetical protein